MALLISNSYISEFWLKLIFESFSKSCKTLLDFNKPTQQYLTWSTLSMNIIQRFAISVTYCFWDMVSIWIHRSSKPKNWYFDNCSKSINFKNQSFCCSKSYHWVISLDCPKSLNSTVASPIILFFLLNKRENPFLVYTITSSPFGPSEFNSYSNLWIY